MKPIHAVLVAAVFAAGALTGALLQGAPVAAAADQPAKPALMLVMGRNYDREALRAYAKALPPVYERYGGEYLAVQRDFEVLEGAYPYESIVVSRWPSLAAAKAFWRSAEYAEVKQLREGNGEFNVVVFEGMRSAAAAAPMARE